jgi:hypothetical protein
MNDCSSFKDNYDLYTQLSRHNFFNRIIKYRDSMRIIRDEKNNEHSPMMKPEYCCSSESERIQNRIYNKIVYSYLLKLYESRKEDEKALFEYWVLYEQGKCLFNTPWNKINFLPYL